MRVAVLILGLILGAIMFFQTFLVTSLSGLSRTPGATYSAGSIGLVMVILWLIAVALVIPVPLASAIAFALAGILGYANSTHFPDLAIWGGVSLILAILSVIGWFTNRRGTRRKEAEEAARHAELVASVARPVPASVACPSCGTWNVQGARFCSECGTALSRATLATN